jgi:hypothetical protein
MNYFDSDISALCTVLIFCGSAIQNGYIFNWEKQKSSKFYCIAQKLHQILLAYLQN